ncbi:MAG: small subunit ribosomal protein, partial [Chloroflexota bacterium]|nr:small subunit ribosomal protein [Chloroflexota bacterium]
RALRNRAVRSEVKTKVVKARRTLTGGPVAEAERYAIALEAIRSLDRAASKGILHKNNASRRKARLAKQFSKLALAPASAAPIKGKKAPAAAAKPAAKPTAKGASAKAAAATAAPSTSKKK